MSYVVARWWTFDEPIGPFRELIRLLNGLSASGDRPLRFIVFDGRHQQRSTSQNPSEVPPALIPARCCSVDATCTSAGASRPPRDGYAATLDVSPTSRLWAPVTKRSSGSSHDRAAAMTYRSFESYVRVNRIRKMPHLLQGWAIPHERSRARQVDQVVEWITSAENELRATHGGVDFVRNMQEMGSYDLTSTVATTSSAWEQLANRFDDMHKVMFADPATFADVDPATLSAAFESVQLTGSRKRSRLVAVARTKHTMRRFVQIPQRLLIE